MPITTTAAKPTVVGKPGGQDKFTISSSPRALVVIGRGGSAITPISFSIQFNDHGQTDLFECRIPILGNPDWPKLTSNQNLPTLDQELAQPVPGQPGPAAAGKPYSINIYAGFPSKASLGAYQTQDLRLRFSGIVDQFEMDFGENVTTFTGRSLAALLVSCKSTSRWQGNNTVQAIQSMLATDLGGLLTLNYRLRPSQTPQPVEKVYSSRFVQGHRNIRIWDIIMAFAEADGMRVWCDGNTLYYWPMRDASMEAQYPAFEVKYGRELKDLRVIHAPQFSKNIEVEVRSWMPTEKLSYNNITRQLDDGSVEQSSKLVDSTSTPVFGTQTVNRSTTTYGSNGTVTTVSGTSTTSGGSVNTGFTRLPDASNKERYVFAKPGLTRDEADRLALHLWHIISENEFNCIFSMPMTQNVLNNVTRNTRFKLTGCPLPSVNQTYRAKRREEKFDMTEGWMLEINGVNHDIPTTSLL